jgi:hypothetical protein
MSRRFLDAGQMVGYDWDEKVLIVTLSEKTAQKMKADGWDVGHEAQIGYFIHIKMEE